MIAHIESCGGERLDRGGLFQSITSVIPRATTVNEAGGPAYKFGPKHALAQMAASGTFGNV